MKTTHCFESKRSKRILMLFLAILISVIVILPSGCLDADIDDTDDMNDQIINEVDKDDIYQPTDVVSEEPMDEATSNEEIDNVTATEEPVTQVVTPSHSSGGSSSSSSSSSSDVSRTVTSGDYTEPVATIAGDLTITGATTGTITLPTGLTVNGDLTVNTPSATVTNRANVDGTVNIIAVSVNTWNQYGNAGGIQMGAEDATFNFYSGNVSDGIEMGAENATFQFIAGNISGGVSLTQPSRVVINATATGLPEITVGGAAEGSDIDNLGGEQLELVAEANVTVAGSVNVTASAGVTPTERTARGSLALVPSSAIYNTNVDMAITYTAGEDLNTSVVNITVPAGFVVADANSLTVAGAGTDVASNTNASYDGNILTVENVTINEGQAIVLTLATQQVSSAGTYDFSATAHNTSKLISNAATASFTSLPNNDADLSALVVSPGTLIPAFNAATTAYTVNVAYDVSSINVTATLSDTNASMLVNGEVATSAVVNAVTLQAAGSTTSIPVVVTAEDGTSTKTYTMTVNRAVDPTSDNVGIATAKAALDTTATLNPVEGNDTNVVTMAQAIVDGVVSGVTVTVSDASGNANVGADGTISYTSSGVTGNVIFALNKGIGTEATSTMSVVVPDAVALGSPTPIDFGASNPSTVLSISGTNFTAEAANTSNWVINVGTTNLTSPNITLQGAGGLATGVIFDFNGTAAEGNISFKALNAALVADMDSNVVNLAITQTQTATPTITTGAQTVSTATINVVGTAAADSAISITGGSAEATGTADGSGDYSIEVTLTADSVNTLSVTAQSAGEVVSEAATVAITHQTQTATPTITTGAQTVSTATINVVGTAAADSAISITGGSAEATGTADGSGDYSIEVTLTADSVNTLSVTAQSAGEVVSEAATVAITHQTQTATPTITTGAQTVSTATINVVGTAAADSAISITGGSAEATGTADGSGDYSIEVTLTTDSVNTLSVTAQSAGEVVSEAATVAITHQTQTATPTITTGAQTVSTATINIVGTAAADSAISITGGSAEATGTADGSGDYSIEVTLIADSVNTLSVTAQSAGEVVSEAATVAITHAS